MLVRPVRLHPAGLPGHRLRAGGSYSYGETIANKRGVVLSTDAGVTGTDMTMDGTDPIHPNGCIPTSTRSSPTRTTRSSSSRRATAASCARAASSWTARRGARPEPRLAAPRWPAASRCCRASRPKLESMNKGLSTLQFQSLSVSPFNVERAAGRHPGQRHLAERRQPGRVAEHDDRRRRPVRLRRRESRVPLPQLHRRVARRQLQQRRHRRLDLDRRPDRRQAREFYAPGDQRSGRQRGRCSRATAGPSIGPRPSASAR